MNIHNVLNELLDKKYINQRQHIILEKLCNSELSAKELSRATQIPLGRIYEPINELIDQQLITKKGKRPSKYTFENPNEKVLSFLQNKFKRFVSDEQKIIDIIEQKNITKIDILKSKDDLTFALVNALNHSKKGIRVVARHGSFPFTYYPSNKAGFIKVRKMIEKERTTLAHTSESKSVLVYNTYQEALKKEKSFEIICNKETFLWHLRLIKKHFGQEYLDNLIVELKNKIKKHNIKGYIIDEYLPMQIFITSMRVVLFHVHAGVGSGIEIHNKETVNLYDSMFDNMLTRSKNVEYYFRNIKRFL